MEIKMTKTEMIRGFAKGRTLIQEEWAHPKEIEWIDELIGEGKAESSSWNWHDGFQCRMRRVIGVPAAFKTPERIKNEPHS